MSGHSVEGIPLVEGPLTQEQTILLDGLRKMTEQSPDLPITANTAAGIVDPGGECTQESRLAAENTLIKLGHLGRVVKIGEPHKVGGDYTEQYELPNPQPDQEAA